jgi:hypothetical protein
MLRRYHDVRTPAFWTAGLYGAEAMGYDQKTAERVGKNLHF